MVWLASIFIPQVVIKKGGLAALFLRILNCRDFISRGMKSLCSRACFSTCLFSTAALICVPDELLEIKVELFGGCKKELDWEGGRELWSGVLALLQLNIGLRNTTNWEPSLYIRSLWGPLAQKSPICTQKQHIHTSSRLFYFLSLFLTHTCSKQTL